MRYDTEQEAVANLQKYLRQLSYTDKDILPVPIDSVFDSATSDSVKSFQRKYGLKESGVADRDTWNAIYEAYLKSLSEYSPPATLPVFPRTPDGYELMLGDEYFAVNILKLILNELRIIYDSFLPLKSNVIYDEATEHNVLEFQKANALTPTGRVDKTTWDSLVNAYTNYAFDYLR